MFLAPVLTCLSLSLALSAPVSLPLTTRDGLSLTGIHETVEKPRAVALLLPGSGNVGADGDISSPFVGAGYRGVKTPLSEQLAEALAAGGIASYRYAKRGFENPLELPHQSFDYLLNDAEDALQQLRAALPGTPVVVVGLSEGALLATHLAARVAVEGLFLLALPTRPVDAMLDYQFVEWPIGVIRDRLDADHDGVLVPAELAGVTAFPVVSQAPSAFDSDGDGNLSVALELIPAYQAAYLQIRRHLADPGVGTWYRSLAALPAFATVAGRVSAPAFLYHGARDPMVNPLTTLPDSRHFKGLRGFRLFEGLGHAFAPLDGGYGELKTSGPFSAGLLAAVVSDVGALLAR